MTLTFADAALYAGALLVLFLTPGPVWMAILARGLSSGFSGVWPLAIGVALGDALWPFVALVGVSVVAGDNLALLEVLRYVAAVMFLFMGVLAIRNAERPITEDSRLTRPGHWAGFLAGVAVIVGNPKAALFYMGLLPGFFDLSQATAADMGVIVALSVVVPLFGNLVLGLLLEKMRRVVTSPKALKRLNVAAGALLILVGLLIAVA